MAQCSLCGKSSVAGNAVSKAQNHTKRKFKPNLQKVSGIVVCAKCLRTVKRDQAREVAKADKQVSV